MARDFPPILQSLCIFFELEIDAELRRRGAAKTQPADVFDHAIRNTVAAHMRSQLLELRHLLGDILRNPEAAKILESLWRQSHISKVFWKTRKAKQSPYVTIFSELQAAIEARCSVIEDLRLLCTLFAIAVQRDAWGRGQIDEASIDTHIAEAVSLFAQERLSAPRHYLNESPQSGLDPDLRALLAETRPHLNFHTADEEARFFQKLRAAIESQLKPALD